MGTERYVFLKDTKHFRVYESEEDEPLLGRLYVRKSKLKGSPDALDVSVKPAKVEK